MPQDVAPATGSWRLSLGRWLLPVLLGAVAAGIALASLEWLYIVLVCGPFWVAPAPWLTTALVYVAAAVPGTVILGLVLYMIPALHRRLAGPAARRRATGRRSRGRPRGRPSRPRRRSGT